MMLAHAEREPADHRELCIKQPSEDSSSLVSQPKPNEIEGLVFYEKNDVTGNPWGEDARRSITEASHEWRVPPPSSAKAGVFIKRCTSRMNPL
jgi:hypothetical protein